MRNELNHIESIDRYILGKMNAEEKKAFEAKMAADSSLVDEVIRQKEIHIAIQSAAFRSDMGKYHEEFETTGKQAGNWKVWLNGIVIAVVGAAALWLSGIFGTLTTKKELSETQKAELEKNKVTEIAKTDFSKDSTELSERTEGPFNKSEGESKSGITTGTAGSIQKSGVQTSGSGTSGTGTTGIATSGSSKNTTANPNPLVQKHSSGSTGKNSKSQTGKKSGSSSPTQPKETDKGTVELSNFLSVFHTVTIDPTRDTSIKMVTSASTIHFAANSMVDKSGNLITEPVTIRYREFRNAAEMAFSGIPMMYNENGNEYRFNSTGMFEIRAFGKDMQPVFMADGKSYTVDYAMTGTTDSCYFFRMDETTKTWKKGPEIKLPPETSSRLQKREDLPYGQILINVKDMFDLEDLPDANLETKAKTKPFKRSKGYLTTKSKEKPILIYQVDTGKITFQIIEKNHSRLTVKDVQIYPDQLTEIDVYLKSKGRLKRKQKRISKKEKVVSERYRKPVWKLKGYRDMNKNYTFSPLWTIKEWVKDSSQSEFYYPIEPGHRHMHLVKGLQCEGFGIHNCDGIAILKNRKKLNARYFDENRNAIYDPELLSLIDLKINAAFSFDPKGEITISKNGNNVFLVMTKEGKLYFFRMNPTASGQVSSNPDFTMTEISDRVKSTADLKQFLGI